MNIKGMEYLIKNKFPVPESMFLFRKISDLENSYRKKYGQEKVWAVVGYDDRTKINDHPYSAKGYGRKLSISEKEIETALIEVDKALDEARVSVKNRIYLTCKTHTNNNTILSGHAFFDSDFDSDKVHVDLFKGNRPSGKDWSPNRSYEIIVKNGKPDLYGVDKDLLEDIKNICKDIIKMGKGAYLDVSKLNNGYLFYHDLYFMKIAKGKTVNKIKKIDLSLGWVYLVNRPYNLFGASLYQRWFDPTQIFELFGISISDNLYIEEHPNVVRRYVIKEQQDKFSAKIEEIIRKDRKKAKKILEKGIKISKQAKGYLKKSPFNDLKSAVDFLIDLVLSATVFSYFSYPILEKIKDKELLSLAEKLRGMSCYPDIVNKIINPLAQKKAGESYQFLTLTEILTNNISIATERKEANKKGKRFLYAKIAGREFIEYTNNVIKIITQLEKVNIRKSVKGQIAYPGKITGRVRLVLTSDFNIEFNEGDILITATTNPTLMPLIKKAGAIVTDEGGITCHAAIVSRELKKPCIIGTKFATHTFKGGELVEVDANKGIVKIIK